MERIGIINRQVLDNSESEAVIQSAKSPRLESQAIMQSSTRTAEQVSKAYTDLKSGRRPGKRRMPAVTAADSSSENSSGSERGRMHQSRRPSDDRKPAAPRDRR